MHRHREGGPGGHAPQYFAIKRSKTTFIVELTITLAPPTINCFLHQWDGIMERAYSNVLEMYALTT